MLFGAPDAVSSSIGILHPPPVMMKPASEQDRPQSDLDRLNEVIRALSLEAKDAIDRGSFPRRRADYAREREGKGEGENDPAIDPALIGRRIVEPLDRDPLVDAYIRWQLTSFDPVLPEMRERDFEALLKALPKFPANPRADRRLIDTLNRAVVISNQRQGGLLTAAEVDTLNTMLEESASAESRHRALSLAAREFRAWLEEAVGELGPRPHFVRLEHISALLAAGWDVEQEKREIDAAFTRSAQDPTLSETDRSRLITAARRLSGVRRGYVQRAVIIERRLEFTSNESAVYDFEVNAWGRALAGRTP